MSQKVSLNKSGFEKRAYSNTIDTSFSQLITPPPPAEEVATVEDFFNLYNTLFYEIPAEGSINSHTFLIERSSEYIGFTEEKDEDIQVLLDEITQLREELLNTQKQVRDIQVSGSLEDQLESQFQNDLDTSTTSEGTNITNTSGGSIGTSIGGSSIGGSGY
jgi:hypothetical protein